MMGRRRHSSSGTEGFTGVGRIKKRRYLPVAVQAFTKRKYRRIVNSLQADRLVYSAGHQKIRNL